MTASIRSKGLTCFFLSLSLSLLVIGNDQLIILSSKEENETKHSIDFISKLYTGDLTSSLIRSLRCHCSSTKQKHPIIISVIAIVYL